jgi:hypothetical protein
MKKVIFIIAIFMTSMAGNAQITAQNSTKKAKTEYSFVWGLFKTNGYSKENSISIEVEIPEISTSSSDTPLETTKYEQKSILWGAIQWTEKRRVPQQ